MATSKDQSCFYKRYQPERLAITLVATGSSGGRWADQCESTSRGTSLQQSMGSGTEPDSGSGFDASRTADDGPGSEARSAAANIFSNTPAISGTIPHHLPSLMKVYPFAITIFSFN